MARALKYTVPPANTSASKEDELDAFLEALHESGTLRTLTGFAGRFEEVCQILVDEANTPAGRRAISNLLIALTALTNVNSDRFSGLMRGFEEGLDAAADSLNEEPPTLMQLARRLNDRETRRGMHAILVLMQHVGEHVRDGADDE